MNFVRFGTWSPIGIWAGQWPCAAYYSADSLKDSGPLLKRTSWREIPAGKGER